MDVEIGIGMNINCESGGTKKEMKWLFFTALRHDL
jgi:hypothetical protein